MRGEKRSQATIRPLFTPPARHADTAQHRRRRELGRRRFDPETGLLYVRTSERISLVRIRQNDGSDPRADADYISRLGGAGSGSRRTSLVVTRSAGRYLR